MARKDLAGLLSERRRGRGPKPGRGLTSLGELLGQIEAEALPPSIDAPISADVWQSIVGPRIADRSSPGRIEPGGLLLVHVSDSVWAQELSLLSSAIIARLAGLGIKVHAMRFLVGRVKAPRRGLSRFERRTVASPAELPKEVGQELGRVQDPALREAIAKAARSSLGEAAADERRAAKRSRRR